MVSQFMKPYAIHSERAKFVLLGMFSMTLLNNYTFLGFNAQHPAKTFSSCSQNAEASTKVLYFQAVPTLSPAYKLININQWK